MFWTEELFGVKKFIIAMCHFQAMPGDPNYDSAEGMGKVIDLAYKDLMALQNGGVDGIMFSNEFSMPYLTSVRTETVASMARVIGELKREIKVPYGVNCLWDPIASLNLAVAVDAKFIREIITGVYASDFGLWNTNAGNTLRHRMAVGAKDVRILFNIVPESASYLGNRDIVDIVKSTIFNNHPDALCVSGLIAGTATDTQVLKKVKEVAKNTLVICNTGCCKENILQQLSIADGAVVATTFKKDGIFENMVDEGRVKEFMDIVLKFRENL